MRISKQALIDAANTAIKADATAEAEHPAKVDARRVSESFKGAECAVFAAVAQ